MRVGIRGIDHVRLACADPATASLAWTRLGFAPSARGIHLGRATGDYAILFAQGAIRLFGPLAPGRGEAAAIPSAIVWAVADMEAAVAALHEAGLHLSAPYDVARQAELPEASLLEHFEILPLPRQATPGLASALCRKVPPLALPRPEWLDHPNGARRLLGATIVVPDTVPLQEPYERLFGAANVQTTDKIIAVRTARQRLLFASPDDFAAMHPEVEPAVAAAASGLALLTVEVADVERAADHLASWQIEYETPGDRRLVVPPDEAGGIILELVAERR